jgi:hypothetical protein
MVCASCSRPVAEGACSVCRSARAELHGTPLPVTAVMVALALLALAYLLSVHL